MASCFFLMSDPSWSMNACLAILPPTSFSTRVAYIFRCRVITAASFKVLSPHLLGLKLPVELVQALQLAHALPQLTRQASDRHLQLTHSDGLHLLVAWTIRWKDNRKIKIK